MKQDRQMGCVHLRQSYNFKLMWETRHKSNPDVCQLQGILWGQLQVTPVSVFPEMHFKLQLIPGLRINVAWCEEWFDTKDPGVDVGVGLESQLNAAEKLELNQHIAREMII